MSKEFIEFEFNGHKSSELGIIRVSDGSRYSEDLLPTSTDKAVQVPGGDGMYYFGSNYTQKQFQIQIAFDSLTKEKLNNLKRILGANQIGKLKFSEDGAAGELVENQKYYMAKSSGVQQLKYLCFKEIEIVEGEPIEVDHYKGEGTITFICYYPFGMIDRASATTSKSHSFQNNGDIEAPIQVVCGFSSIPSDYKILPNLSITLNSHQVMTFPPLGITLSSHDTTARNIVIDNESNLIYTTTSTGARTGFLYNNQISNGDFFKVTLGSNVIAISEPASYSFSELYY